MKPTRRGAVVVAIGAFAVLQGALFGQRALNYVATPAAVLLAIGAISLWRAETPTVERSAVRPGFPGARRLETVSIGGRGITTVIDSLPEGVGGERIERTGAAPFGIERELVLRDRGRYTLEPVTASQRDPFGVVATTRRLGDRNEVVVYPELYDIDRTGVLTALFGDDPTTGPELFGWLREYQEGDPLQRIDWKQTARHDELLVVGSEPNRQYGPISVSVDGRDGNPDEVSAVAASLIVLFFDAGFDVEVTVRDNRGVDIEDERQLAPILRSLAGLGGDRGRELVVSGEYDDADVSIRGTGGSVIVRLDDEETTFEQLRSDPTGTATGGRAEGAVIDG